MIRIARSTPEPKTLGTARAKRLAAAASVYAAGGGGSKLLYDELTGYDPTGVKEALYRDQHGKCAWCERKRDFSSSPVEHYRPKAGAWRHLPGATTKRTSGTHYWWLTWTWENLLFACARCNDRGHKGNYFPLARRSRECAVPVSGGPAVDLPRERPLLLDPAVDSFLDHVRWKPFNTAMARKLWTWSPEALTDRGRATIDILKLHELADDVRDRAVTVVLPSVEEIEQHLDGRRRVQAQARWSTLLGVLAPDQPLTAAMWCVLERWIPAALRALHGLPDPPRPV